MRSALTVTLIWLFAFSALYWVYCLFWGVVTARIARTASDFFLGDRSIPSWIFVLSSTGISYSGWTILGQPAVIFRDGFQYAVLAMCAIIIPLTGVLFLKRQWILGKRFTYMTQAEMLGDYFTGETVRLLVLIVAIMFAVPFLGMQLAASGYLIQIVTDGAIHWTLAMWVFTISMFLYTCLGGLRAVAYVAALQCMLLFAGIIGIGFIAYDALGGFSNFLDVLEKFSTMEIGPSSSTNGANNSFFETPGVIQFVEGLGREAPSGGIWTATMVMTYSFALMGIQAAPAFSIWAFSCRDPRGFGPQQVWVSGVVMGAALVFFGVLQGVGANFLGASPELNTAGLAVAQVLPELSSGKEYGLSAHYIHTLASKAPWLMALLAMCAIAAIHSMAAAYASATGTMFARDVYKRYLNPEAGDGLQKFYARVAIGLVLLVALTLATFAPRAQAQLGVLALGFGCQLIPALAAICWIPWITRQGVLVGLASGLVAVVVTDSFGMTLCEFFGFQLPWGRWPWTIHSAGWGIAVNVTLCLLVSCVSQDVKGRAHRDRFHAVFQPEMVLTPGKNVLSPVAWTLALGWLFFAIGPGAVIGNTLFSLPDGGVAGWALGMPSIWVWQTIFWALGVLVLWLLAYKLKMSTSPKIEIEPEIHTLRTAKARSLR